MFESRVSETNLRLNVHPKLGYEALIKSILNSGLVIKTEDEEGLKVVAETSKIKSMMSNSYGEVVTFFINGYQNDSYCLVNIHSKGCSSAGSYSHSTIFSKITESLRDELGDSEVETTVQRADEHVDDATIFEQIEERIERNTIRLLAERNSVELQNVANAGGNVYQVSLEQQDEITAFSKKLSDDNAIKFMTLYAEELDAFTNKNIDDVNKMLNEQAINQDALGMLLACAFFVVMIFVFFV